TVRGFVVRFPGNDRVRQIADGGLTFLVRRGVILRSDSGLAPGERGLACRYASLSPLHFAVSNAIGILRKGGQCDGEERRPQGGSCSFRRLIQTPYTAVHCNDYYVLGVHKYHLFFLGSAYSGNPWFVGYLYTLTRFY